MVKTEHKSVGPFLPINSLAHLCRHMTDLYSQRGVSSQKEDVHEAIKNLDQGLFAHSFCKILPDIAAGDQDFVNIMHADTAGTKSIIAYLYWKETGDTSVWKSIAQDAIVMNIDDMVCSGATSQFILSSTIARNKHLIPKEVLKAVIEGCDELLKEWKEYGVHIQHAGGETADVGDLVKTIDVGYTAFARFKKEEVILIDPQPGDVIIGFASFGQCNYENTYNSGIGCNGLTSARHDILDKRYLQFKESYDQNLDESICYIGKYGITDEVNGLAVGKLLLSPTRTFVPVLIPIIQKYRKQIHGIVHNTGGGQTKCMKYIPGNVIIEKNNLFKPPVIFDLIQQASGISTEEMFKVFNMGTRMEMYVPENIAQDIIEISKGFGVDAQIVGQVKAGSTKELIIKYP